MQTRAASPAPKKRAASGAPLNGGASTPIRMTRLACDVPNPTSITEQTGIHFTPPAAAVQTPATPFCAASAAPLKGAIPGTRTQPRRDAQPARLPGTITQTINYGVGAIINRPSQPQAGTSPAQTAPNPTPGAKPRRDAQPARLQGRPTGTPAPENRAPTPRTRALQRGYNLVEMMIALTVLGIVIGGALIPLQSRLQQEEISKAADQLQQAKRAVIAYALANRTPGFRVDYFDDIEYEAPAGRPVMPCPDIDGDGLEDRNSPNTNPGSVISASGFAFNSRLGCQRPKGLLPWRTLGLPKGDPWGNYLTYFVSYNYYSGVTGFDETISADAFGRRLEPQEDSEGNLFYRLESTGQSGAVVCNELLNDAVTGGCPNLALTNVEAGVFTPVALTVGARRIPAYDDLTTAIGQGVVDAAVFVIVSHGRNGWGAINVNNDKCREAPPITNNIAEIANAYYNIGHQFTAGFGSGSFRPDCVPQTAAFRLHLSRFVTTPISNISSADLHQPDDIVVWAGRHEINGYLARNGVYPVEKLEFLLE